MANKKGNLMGERWRNQAYEYIRNYGPQTVDLLLTEVKTKTGRPYTLHQPSRQQINAWFRVDKRFSLTDRIKIPNKSCNGRTGSYLVNVWGINGEGQCNVLG